LPSSNPTTRCDEVMSSIAESSLGLMTIARR